MLQHQLVRSTALGTSIQATEFSVTSNTEERKAWEVTQGNLKFLREQCGKVYSWGSLKLERKLKIMVMPKLMMVDWDPAEGELDHHYTIHNASEVFQILRERVEAHPDELWRVYETPSGGIHAFLVSHTLTPEEGYSIQTEIQGDTLYRDFCFKRGKWTARVGPKPGREGDFVARFIGHWGTGTALAVNQEAMKVHDSFLLN